MRHALAIVVIFLLLCVFNTKCHGFWYQTKLGIQVWADDATAVQYNQHWKKMVGNVNIGPKWKQINWNILDLHFDELRKAYGINKDPSKLTVVIWPLNYSCVDESAAPYNYEFGGDCIDGLLDGNTIYIHLGDDPGQFWQKTIKGVRYVWDRPFCATALTHELCHWFRDAGYVECPGELPSTVCQ